MIEIDPKIEEKVILVGICPQGQSIEKIEEYLDELAFLAETAGGITVKSFIQKWSDPTIAFCRLRKSKRNKRSCRFL